MRTVTRPRRALMGLVAAVGLLLTTVPGPVLGATGISEVVGGYGSVCIQRTDATAWCWGENEDNQVGDGTTKDRFSPVRVRRTGGGLLGGVKRLAGTSRTRCVVTTIGTVRCWGDNASAGAGIGHKNAAAVATTLLRKGKPIRGVTAVAVGHAHGCLLRTKGAVWCWGQNAYGEVGDGTTDERLRPVPVRRANGKPLLGAIAVAAGWHHSCVLMANATVRCWGNNSAGEAGAGTIDEEHHVPVTVRTTDGVLTGVKRIFSGGQTACAIRSGGALWCWGANDSYQVGDGTQNDRHVAVRVHRGAGFMTGVTSVSMVTGHVCAVRAKAAWCWGINDDGQAGIGTTDPAKTPVRVRKDAGSVFPADVRAIGAYEYGSCLARTNGQLWCWGSNAMGERATGGTGPDALYPAQVSLP